MSGWDDRRRADLICCLDSFEGQFRLWETRTAEVLWQTHYSQIRAITAMMGGLREGLRNRLEGKLDEELELHVLSAWRVWDAFRSRLGQRQEESFRDGLAAADEIAWTCRMPIAASREDDGGNLPKEPALVYLSGMRSPVAMQRYTGFNPEFVPGEALDKPSTALLQCLPVPLIGMPWHEIFHAPGMVAIAHEAGHVIETDFSLTADLDLAIARAVGDAEFAKRWKNWRAEIFADHFAVRHCGPAFAGMLGDVLRRFPGAPAKSYPPHPIRMELCLVLLEKMGLEAEASAARLEAGQEKPAPPEMKWVRKVVDELSGLRISKAGTEITDPQLLEDVVKYDRKTHEQVKHLADELAGSRPPPNGTPAVLTAAACRLLFEKDPGFFNEANMSAYICGAILKGGGGGTRRRSGGARGAIRGGARFLALAAESYKAYSSTGKDLAERWPVIQED